MYIIYRIDSCTKCSLGLDIPLNQIKLNDLNSWSFIQATFSMTCENGSHITEKCMKNAWWLVKFQQEKTRVHCCSTKPFSLPQKLQEHHNYPPVDSWNCLNLQNAMVKTLKNPHGVTCEQTLTNNTPHRSTTRTRRDHHQKTCRPRASHAENGSLWPLATCFWKNRLSSLKSELLVCAFICKISKHSIHSNEKRNLCSGQVEFLAYEIDTIKWSSHKHQYSCAMLHAQFCFACDPMVPLHPTPPPHLHW